MTKSRSQSLLFRLIAKLVTARQKNPHLKKGKKNVFLFDKRQKFAIGMLCLSVILFAAKYAFNAYGLITAVSLGFLSDAILFWAIRKDLKDNFSIQVFILPFLYSLSFGLFSFLTPARLLTRILLIGLYALGSYSVFLSENIFTVASIRTIALLNSARIVSLVISLVTFFFLASTTFSVRTTIIPTVATIFFFSFLLTMHAVWTYTLDGGIRKNILWVFSISFCILELASILWFWPTTPVIVALFLTSIWYVFVGLTHVWFDKRLFKGVLWEYLWVSVVTFFILIAFTKWQ